MALITGATTIYALHKPERKRNEVGAKATVPLVVNTSVTTATSFKQPATLDEMMNLPPADLGKVDVALMNLLCAEGLPGSETLSIPECLATLDQWALRVRLTTQFYRAEFLRDPQRSHTLAEYKMMMLINVLHNVYGVHYDSTQAIAQYGADPATDRSVTGQPNNELGSEFFEQSNLSFISGLLSPQRSGTCSSLPVLVAAVGRRLDYPIQLVTTFRHMFVRWDDGQERFNIETTVVGGLQVVSDYEYRQWPRPVNEAMMAAEGYLQPQTPAQVLACFLYSRAGCLIANGRSKEAETYVRKCLELVPTSRKYRELPAYPKP